MKRYLIFAIILNGLYCCTDSNSSSSSSSETTSQNQISAEPQQQESRQQSSTSQTQDDGEFFYDYGRNEPKINKNYKMLDVSEDLQLKYIEGLCDKRHFSFKGVEISGTVLNFVDALHHSGMDRITDLKKIEDGNYQFTQDFMSSSDCQSFIKCAPLSYTVYEVDIVYSKTYGSGPSSSTPEEHPFEVTSVVTRFVEKYGSPSRITERKGSTNYVWWFQDKDGNVLGAIILAANDADFIISYSDRKNFDIEQQEQEKIKNQQYNY